VKDERKRMRVTDLQAMKERGEPICMLTAYDYTMARLLDDAVDVLLVGDSLGMVQLGYDTTLPVSMEEMIHHTAAVNRGRKHALLVADMPFLSYQGDVNHAVMNAGSFLQKAGADAVKLEGGRTMTDVIARMVDVGIPVMGHLGLTPQSVHKFGGFKVQGRTQRAAEALHQDALALQEAGVFSIVLEGIPASLATELTAALTVPTIGIGAGNGCDGQVLVTNDMLGMFDDFTPKFVKRYASIGNQIRQAADAYRQEVQSRSFPGPEHTYASKADQEATKH